MKKSLINTMLDDLSLFSFKETSKLKTDIKEYDDYYVFEIDVAGHDKKDIDIRVEDEYMVVEVKSCCTSEEKTCKEETCDFQYIRKERYVGSTSRSYYVGNVVEKDIKANFNNGLLTVKVPKEKESKNQKAKIEIE